METILVVGATGQLGFAAVKELLARGKFVRALARNPGAAARFRELGAEPAFGDMTQLGSLQSACRGVSVVVATANAAVPSRTSDTFEAVERHGYRNLIRASSEAGVSKFVYTSAPRSKHEQSSKFFQLKRETEELIVASRLNYVIFRADIFMDVAFAMMGSSIPVRGAEAATVQRPFPFVSKHFQRIKNSIENRGVAMIPGDGHTRHSFVCIDDVARFLAEAACGHRSGIFDTGGPEALTFMDVVFLYEAILRIKLRVSRMPAWMARLAATMMEPFAPAAANLMFLNFLAATEDSAMESATATAATFNVELTRAATFLQRKYATPETALLSCP